jgi:hypothetical protein
MITQLWFLVLAAVGLFGWYRAQVHWQRALERERLLLELVRKLIQLLQQLPSITEDLRDEGVHETRH